MESHSVTIVLPVYNAQRTVEQSLRAVLAQSIKPDKIIVVDDGSTDSTPDIARLFPEITVLTQKNAGPAAARNTGIAAADTELVAFTDGDCVPTTDWLKELLAAFDGPMIGGAGGIVRGIGKNLITRYVDSIKLLDPSPTNNPEFANFLVTSNACFRRDVLMKVGMFSGRFRKPGGEEPDLCRRVTDAGYKLRALPNALVWHHHKQTLRVLIRTLANYGEGRYLLSTAYPEYAFTGSLWLKLLMEMLSFRKILVGIRWRLRPYGLKDATGFSLLQYFTDTANIWGYIRASRQAEKAKHAV